MLKDSTAVIGLGLGGMTVTYEFQERNYSYIFGKRIRTGY